MKEIESSKSYCQRVKEKFFLEIFLALSISSFEKMKIKERLSLNDEEQELATIFLAERITLAYQYFLQRKNTKRPFLPQADYSSQVFQKAPEMITAGEETRLRRQTIYLAINDLSANINHNNDQQKLDLILYFANYQLRDFELDQWGEKWQRKLKNQPN